MHRANLQLMQKLQAAIEQKLVRSCHDLSEGGLAVAAAEMAFSGGLGIDISLPDIVCEGQVHDIARLFAESAGRFLVEIDPENQEAFETLLSDQASSRIGTVTDTGRLVIDQYIDIPVAELKQAWQGTFNW